MPNFSRLCVNFRKFNPLPVYPKFKAFIADKLKCPNHLIDDPVLTFFAFDFEFEGYHEMIIPLVSQKVKLCDGN